MQSFLNVITLQTYTFFTTLTPRLHGRSKRFFGRPQNLNAPRILLQSFNPAFPNTNKGLLPNFRLYIANGAARIKLLNVCCGGQKDTEVAYSDARHKTLWMPWSIIKDNKNLDYYILELQLRFLKQPLLIWPRTSTSALLTTATSLSYLPATHKIPFSFFLTTASIFAVDKTLLPRRWRQ